MTDHPDTGHAVPAAGEKTPFLALDAIAVLFKFMGGLALAFGGIAALIAAAAADDAATKVAYAILAFAGWSIIALFLFGAGAAVDWMLRVERHLRRIADR